MYRHDVFASIAGGLNITEPGIDLGILLAVASSLQNRKIDPHTVAIGEVGLGGEVRSSSRMESRIKEAIQMGFRRCLIPKKNVKTVSEKIGKKIQLIGVNFVEEAVRAALN